MAARFYQLKTVSLSHWLVPQLSFGGARTRPKPRSTLEGLWAEVLKETGGAKNRFKIRDLFADERFSWGGSLASLPPLMWSDG